MAGSLVHSLISTAIVNIEVETDEEDHGDEERDKSEENELLEQARFLKVDCELILFFGQFVTVAFEKGLTNVFHNDNTFLLKILITIINNFLQGRR